MRRLIQVATVCAVVLLAVSGAWAGLGTGVKETILPNGLKVITKEVHVAPVVSVAVFYKAGGRNEYPGITGISHLLEHMMFKGTPRFPDGDIWRLFTRNGAVINGTTGADTTNYFETLGSDRLELALDIEADRMANCRIDPADHASEMTVVRSELEGGENNASSLLYQEVAAAAFRAHPYQFPVIGFRTDVEGITSDDIYRYYKTYYKPNNAVLVIVGDFDTDAALKLVEEHFGPIPAGDPVPPMRVTEPPQMGPRQVVVERPGTVTRLLIAYHIPNAVHPDTPALQVLDQILSGGTTSRIYQALVETRLATNAGSNAGLEEDAGLFTFSASVAQGVDPAKVQTTLYDIVRQAQEQQVTPAELQKAKDQIEAGFIRSQDSLLGQALQLGRYEVTAGSWRFADQYLAAVKGVTAEDVQRVAQQYLVPENMTLGWFIPTEAGTATSLSTPAKPAGEASVARTAPVSEETKAPAATARSEPVRMVLPNGLVLIVQENHANATVAITGSIGAGSAFDPPGKSGTAEFTASMLTRGTTSHSKREIAEALERVGASANAYVGPESASFSGSALSKDGELLVSTLAEVLRTPTFPQEELEKLRAQSLDRMVAAQESTGARGGRAFFSTIFPKGHPYGQLPFDEAKSNLQAITRDDLVAFHKAYYRPDSTIIVIVGDVQTEHVQALVEKYFGDWQGEGPLPKVSIPLAPLPEKPDRIVISMMDKSQVDANFGYPSPVSRTDPDFYAVNVMGRILGGGIPSRLGTRIRDKDGLAYGVGGGFRSMKSGGTFIVQFGVNPANVDRAVKAMYEEITRLRDEGATQDELDEALDAITGSYAVSLATNSGIASALLDTELYRLGLDYLRKRNDFYRQVTLEQVNAAAKKYLHPENGVLVLAGPYQEK